MSCQELPCCASEDLAYSPRVESDFGIAGELSGLMWEMPIIDTASPWVWPGSNGGSVIDIVTAKLSGLTDLVYDVELLFRGIMEIMDYVGGSVVLATGGYMNSGGAPGAVLTGHNIYKLEISNPAATYYLNRWDGIVSANPVYGVRYTATVQMRGGATITLTADPVNGGEITNFGGVTIASLSQAGDPAMMLTQAVYDATYKLGQFLQMDVLNVTPQIGV